MIYTGKDIHVIKIILIHKIFKLVFQGYSATYHVHSISDILIMGLHASTKTLLSVLVKVQFQIINIKSMSLWRSSYYVCVYFIDV